MPGCSLRDRKSTRLNSSHAEIYTLSLHDALPIYFLSLLILLLIPSVAPALDVPHLRGRVNDYAGMLSPRSEEHTSELQSRRDLHSFPTRRSSDLFPLSSHSVADSFCRASP